ncbi:hypothetical protein [Thiocystis violascens]|uniref:Uncharacterized protein n=1 Tax=Thiocystis violascens (strain ATCC 17096 / DSM 198 / 6111) TaxID=765911 RepID=I3YC88_THIV6|nr:hypothetical protein [Thiocystis violascens]AFL74606.1 hypothetical protein Thivi_2687 [Thiocystis violascens DSM 198]
MAVSTKPHQTLSVLSLSALLALTAHAPVSQAFDFGNMMNPSRWMNGDDRDDEPYADGPYPYGPPGGYGYGPGVYGAPYGAPGYYGGAPAVAPVAPAAPMAGNADQAEIETLKRRIEELEARQPPGPPPTQQTPATDWPSAPAFRPMNQY